MDFQLKKWKDDSFSVSVNTLVTTLLLFVLIFVYTNFPEYEKPAVVYALLLILAVLGERMLGTDQSVGFGTEGALKKSLVAGGVIAVLLHSVPTLSVAAPTLAVAPSAGLLWAFFFVVLTAAYVEEKIFRQVLVALFERYFGRVAGNPNVGYVAAVLVATAGFAVFHLAAFGASPDKILTSALFGLVALAGNQQQESAGFGWGLHNVNNFISAIVPLLK